MKKTHVSDLTLTPLKLSAVLPSRVLAYVGRPRVRLLQGVFPAPRIAPSPPRSSERLTAAGCERWRWVCSVLRGTNTMKLLGLTSLAAYLREVIKTAGTSSWELWFCWLGSQRGRAAVVPVRGSVIGTLKCARCWEVRETRQPSYGLIIPQSNKICC